MKRIIGITAILITMAASISGSDPRPPAPSCGSVAYAQSKPECSNGAMRGGQTSEDQPLNNEVCRDGKWVPMEAGGDPSKATCPKYQHMEITGNLMTSYASDAICAVGPDGIGRCDIPTIKPKKTCVDDLRIVTEAQWQDLMQQLHRSVPIVPDLELIKSVTALCGQANDLVEAYDRQHPNDEPHAFKCAYGTVPILTKRVQP